MNSLVSLPVAAAVDTDTLGRGGDIAIQSVFRVVDRHAGSMGTGFLHKSGNIITADHVVPSEFKPNILLSDGSHFRSRVIARDKGLDIAILAPSGTFPGTSLFTPLEIAKSSAINIGTQVSTWGFPGGYPGTLPMLSTGVLSAVINQHVASDRNIQQWVVNAAFNSGNSGGPLLHIETGHVIGVVSSKLAPISPMSVAMLDALEKNRSGFTYSGQSPNGPVHLNETQIIARIIQELRSQVQLVIGMAVFLDDLRAFLEKNNIEP